MADYLLEIYEPESSKELLIAFRSASPFMTFECGSLIDQSEWGLPGRFLRVVSVAHGIAETDVITHKVRLFTEAVDGDEGQVSRYTKGVLSTFSKIRDRAKDVAGSSAITGLKEMSLNLLDTQMPRIQALLSDTLGTLTKEAIYNDALMAVALGTVYSRLPAQVRILVKQDAFVAMCLRNRERFFTRPEPEGPTAIRPIGEQKPG
jgi:hypothetical protein